MNRPCILIFSSFLYITVVTSTFISFSTISHGHTCLRIRRNNKHYDSSSISTSSTSRRRRSSYFLIPLNKVQDLSFLASLNLNFNGTLFNEIQNVVNEDDNVVDTFTTTNFTFYLAEMDDLPAVATLIVDTFGADAITLSTNLSTIEKFFLHPSVSVWNSYAATIAYMEVLNGLRQRILLMNNNTTTISNGNNDYTTTNTKQKEKQNILLSPPRVMNHSSSSTAANILLAHQISEKSSIILVLVGQLNNKNNNNHHHHIVATVELRLQPTDAKIPFSQPWIDRLERNLAMMMGISSTAIEDISLQPYLSNLCVAPQVRRRNIGKALVRCVEYISKDIWGYKKLYLHVDSENIPAMKLYAGEGYHDVNIRWKPFWAGDSVKISYLVKDFY